MALDNPLKAHHKELLHTQYSSGNTNITHKEKHVALLFAGVFLDQLDYDNIECEIRK